MSHQTTPPVGALAATPQVLQSAINKFLKGPNRWEYGQALDNQGAGYYNAKDGFWDIDCSGLVVKSLFDAGFSVPDITAAQLSTDGTNFATVYSPRDSDIVSSKSNVRPGDIVCFAKPNHAANHIGIVAYFNASTGYGVMVDAVGTPQEDAHGRDDREDGLKEKGGVAPGTILQYGAKYSLFCVNGLPERGQLGYADRLQNAKNSIPPDIWAQVNTKTNNFTTLGLYDEPEAVSRIMRPIGAHHPTGIKISAGDAPQLAATNQLLTSVAFDSNLDSKSIEVSYFGQSGAIRIAASSGEYCVIPAGCIDSNTQIVFPNGSSVAFSSLPGVNSLYQGSTGRVIASASTDPDNALSALYPDTTGFTLADYLQGSASTLVYGANSGSGVDLQPNNDTKEAIYGGFGGADIQAGDGTVTVVSGGGAGNVFQGGAGTDTFTLQQGDTVDAGTGTSVISGGAFTTINGSTGSLSVTAGVGDFINGGTGQATITAADGDIISSTCGNGSITWHGKTLTGGAWNAANSNYVGTNGLVYQQNQDLSVTVSDPSQLGPDGNESFIVLTNPALVQDASTVAPTLNSWMGVSLTAAAVVSNNFVPAQITYEYSLGQVQTGLQPVYQYGVLATSATTNSSASAVHAIDFQFNLAPGSATIDLIDGGFYYQGTWIPEKLFILRSTTGSFADIRIGSESPNSLNAPRYIIWNDGTMSTIGGGLVSFGPETPPSPVLPLAHPVLTNPGVSGTSSPLGTTVTNADGSTTTQVTSSNGVLTATTTNLDKSYSVAVSSTGGSSTVSAYSATGHLLSSQVRTAAGYLTASSTSNADGSGTQFTDDGLGNTTLVTIAADGSNIEHNVNSDGSYTDIATSILGTVTSQTHSAAGYLTASSTTNADGSGTSFTDDGQGDTTLVTAASDGSSVEHDVNSDGSKVDFVTNIDGSSVETDTASNGSYRTVATNTSGNTVENDYSAAGVLTQTITTTYNADGTVASDSLSLANGASSGHNYGANSAVTAWTNNGQGVTTSIAADGLGNTSEHDVFANGSTKDTLVNADLSGSSQAHAANGALTTDSATTAAGATSGHTYTTGGSVATSWSNDGQGNTTLSTFDSLGNVTVHTVLANGTVMDAVAHVDHSGSSQTHSASGALIADSTTLAAGSSSGHTYSASGSVATSWTNDGHGNTMLFTYDGLGNVAMHSVSASGIVSDSVTHADHSSSSQTYSATGALLADSTTTAAGASSGHAYNVNGSVVTSWTNDGHGNATTHTVNADGSTMDYVTTANGASSQQTHSSAGVLLNAAYTFVGGTRETVQLNADGSTTTAYIAANNTLSQLITVDAKGFSHTHAYVGGGVDLYTVAAGEGAETVQASSGSTSTFQLALGAGAVQAARSGNDITFSYSPTDYVVVKNWFAPTNNGAVSVRLANGTTMSAAQINAGLTTTTALGWASGVYNATNFVSVVRGLNPDFALLDANNQALFGTSFFGSALANAPQSAYTSAGFSINGSPVYKWGAGLANSNATPGTIISADVSFDFWNNGSGGFNFVITSAVAGHVTNGWTYSAGSPNYNFANVAKVADWVYSNPVQAITTSTTTETIQAAAPVVLAAITPSHEPALLPAAQTLPAPVMGPVIGVPKAPVDQTASDASLSAPLAPGPVTPPILPVAAVPLMSYFGIQRVTPVLDAVATTVTAAQAGTEIEQSSAQLSILPPVPAPAPADPWALFTADALTSSYSSAIDAFNMGTVAATSGAAVSGVGAMTQGSGLLAQALQLAQGAYPVAEVQPVPAAPYAQAIQNWFIGSLGQQIRAGDFTSPTPESAPVVSLAGASASANVTRKIFAATDVFQHSAETFNILR